MTTFSQLVDDMVAETRRPDMRTELTRYLNQSLRECHTEPERGNVVFFKSNYQETQLTATSDTGYLWSIPNPATFQGIGAVRFDSVWVDGDPVYAKEVLPGPRLNQVDYAFQRAGSAVSFKGYGGLNALISIAYYEFTPKLKYFAEADRPATWDDVTGWSYHVDYDIDDDTRATARELSGNWLLDRWDTVLEEGVRAKVYKRLSDDTRQRTAYSLFMQQRKGIIGAEGAELLGAV